jgi:hypothetical protein
MNQPSKETAKLLLQLMRKTSLPIILKKIEGGDSDEGRYRKSDGTRSPLATS